MGNFKISIDFSGLWELAIFVFIVFLILKLTKLIVWSWVWVLSPLWIIGAIWLVFFLTFVIILLFDRMFNR